MARLISAVTLIALSAVVLAGAPATVQAQGKDAASIKFTNRTSKPLLIQGVSVVGGTFRKGPMIPVLPGKYAWDNSVPPGARHYRIFDGTQPSRILNPSVRVDDGGGPLFPDDSETDRRVDLYSCHLTKKNAQNRGLD